MEFKIGDHTYRTGRLDAMKQFHVGLKIGPAFAALAVAKARAATSLPKLAEGVEASAAEDAAATVAMAEVFKAMADALATMPEADVNYLLKTCLPVCERLEGTAWAKVMASNGALMFEKETDFKVLLRLVMEVIKENLGGFFAAPWGAMA